MLGCAERRGVHLVSDHDILGDSVRRHDRPDLAFDGSSDLEPGRTDVRNALACDAVRRRILQPSGRGFFGVLLGGIVFEKFGSYTPIWWLSVAFGVMSALINLPIVEQPAARSVAQPA